MEAGHDKISTLKEEKLRLLTNKNKRGISGEMMQGLRVN